MKTEIDKFFSDNYEMLRGITQARIIRTQRHIDPETLISNAYIYLIKRIDDLTVEDIPKWAISYINTELTYPKSVTNHANNKLNKSYIDIDDVICVKDESCLMSDIELNDFKSRFKTTLDRYDQIIWDVYNDKGITTKRGLAEHFNIDASSARIYINRIKEKFKDYVEAEKRI